jgi:hypothetical protein
MGVPDGEETVILYILLFLLPCVYAGVRYSGKDPHGPVRHSL